MQCGAQCREAWAPHLLLYPSLNGCRAGLCGISYDPKTKRYTCAIERVWRSIRLAGPLLHGGFDIHHPTGSIYTHPCSCQASSGVDLFRLSA